MLGGGVWGGCIFSECLGGVWGGCIFSECLGGGFGDMPQYLRTPMVENKMAVRAQ